MEDYITIWKEKIKHIAGLKAQLLMSPELRDSDIKNFGSIKNTFESAVLILLFKKDNEINILLTKRSSNLKKHSGQISFPGGKKDISDNDLLQTALREAKEEIGLNHKVTIIGKLTPLLIPITNFYVHQYVAYCDELPPLSINKDEVESLIELPVKELNNSQNIKSKIFGTTTSGREIIAPYYSYNNHEIWGATAMMISELYETLFKEEY